jgi:ATP-dependent Zn protease
MEQVRAARRTARRAGRPLRVEDLEGQIFAEDPRGEKDIRRAAVHEAGHALAGLLCETGALASVNIMPLADSGGGTQFHERQDFFRTRSGYEARAIMLLAGRAAEEVLLSEPSQGAGGTPDSDLGRATHLVVSMFASLGLGDSLTFRAPADTALELMGVDPLFVRKIEKALADLYERAMDLLRQHRNTLEAIADTLVERRFLSGAEVESMVRKSQAGGPPE